MRRVCKPWNAFLSAKSSYFIKSHLNHSLRNKHYNETVVVFNTELFRIHDSKHALPCTVYDLSQSPIMELNDLVKLPRNFPQFSPNRFGGHVIGPVNGLICFYIGHGYKVNGIYIWNPSMSVVKRLPPFSEPLIPYDYNGRSRYIFSFGFGFDPMTDDYKVLKITHDRDKSVWLQVEVYSMKKDSWEFIVGGGIGMFVDDHDGHLHALCYYFNKVHIQTIIVFDLGVESSFRQISLPDSVVANYHKNHHRYNILGMLDGKLCVVSYAQHDGKFEVWVMNEYGVARDSWVKSHALSKFKSKACGHISPYGFTSNNKFLFFNDSKGLFGCYDQETDKVTYFGSDTSCVDGVVPYVDSLVWYT